MLAEKERRLRKPLAAEHAEAEQIEAEHWRSTGGALVEVHTVGALEEGTSVGWSWVDATGATMLAEKERRMVDREQPR